jgi:hypothetical protein
MKSLKLCIKLLEKYCKHDYHRFGDLHDKKWGEAVYTWEKVEGSDDKPLGPYHKLHSNRPNVITPEDIVQEKTEFFEAGMADEREEQRDLKLIHNIIAKYCNYWWD